MSAEDMRRSGYALIDALVELAEQPDPAIRRATREQMRATLGWHIPDEPWGIDETMRTLLDDVVPWASKPAHPGYFAYIPSSTTWPSALADLVASVTNIYTGTWMESPGASHLELVLIDTFRSWLGMPEGTEGVLVSGGSAANLTALTVARELRVGAQSDSAVVYCSDQTHSSVGRSARVLGFGPAQVRVVPSDRDFRLRPDALRAVLAADRAAGRLPLAVVASAGSTNTGSVDPLDEIATICAEHGVWLHVDAAYGGFAALTERGAAVLTGLDRADSVTMDPHKWLFQPMECAAVLVREPGALERAFAVLPDYLAEAHGDPDDVDFSDRGLQLSRNARSFKVWASLATFGVDAFRRTIDRNLDLVALADAEIRADPALELMNPATLGIVCFRRDVPGASESVIARVNAWLVQAYEETGAGLVSTTRLHGRYAVRLVVMNHLTGESDVRFVLDFFARTDIPDELIADETADGAGDLASQRPLDVLSPDGRQRLLARSFRRSFPAGTVLVARWASDRDLYVVVSGEAVASIDGVEVSRLGAGAMFGEIAAFDWGSGYGSLRTADVVALTDVEILMVPVEVVDELMSVEPQFRALLAESRARRLTRQ